MSTADACVGYFEVVEDGCSLLPNREQREACELSEAGGSFPREWKAVPENFDSIGAALLTVFEIMTGEARRRAARIPSPSGSYYFNALAGVNWSIITGFGIKTVGYQQALSTTGTSPAVALYYMFGFFFLSVQRLHYR